MNKIRIYKTLYDRLGGVYSLGNIINYFSDELINNSYLRDWSTNKLDRLLGLKFMRTLWVCAITGGPFKYSPSVAGKCPMSLENAHKKFQISPEEFDEVAKVLSSSLDHFSVPQKEKNEVLSAFASHKTEVNTGFLIQKIYLLKRQNVHITLSSFIIEFKYKDLYLPII